jgi:hypothetical protein
VRLTRTLPILLLTAVAGLLLAATPASADPYEPYPPGPAPGGVSDTTVPDGGKVTFSGSGYSPYEHVVITVSYDTGAALRLDQPTRGFADVTAAYVPARAGSAAVPAALPLRKATLATDADGNGNWSISVALTEAGTATLSAIGNMGHSTIQTLTVLPSTSPNSGTSDTSLAVTGENNGRLLALQVAGGGSAVLVGGMLIWFAVGRRRRTLDAA